LFLQYQEQSCNKQMNIMKTALTPTRTVCTLLLASMISISCSKNTGSLPGNNLYTLSGTANGNQVVPAVNGSGSATITGSYNPTSRLLTYTAGWTSLSGAPVTAGFYAGPAGTNGTLSGMPWTINEGTTGTGQINGSVYLTPEQAAELTSGGWYYSLGTNNFPGGEVRGQITAQQQ
jgi:hypothetical protein